MSESLRKETGRVTAIVNRHVILLGVQRDSSYHASPYHTCITPHMWLISHNYHIIHMCATWLRSYICHIILMCAMWLISFDDIIHLRVRWDSYHTSKCYHFTRVKAYLCICIYIYICMCMYVYIYIYICTNICYIYEESESRCVVFYHTTHVTHTIPVSHHTSTCVTWLIPSISVSYIYHIIHVTHISHHTCDSYHTSITPHIYVCDVTYTIHLHIIHTSPCAMRLTPYVYPIIHVTHITQLSHRTYVCDVTQITHLSHHTSTCSTWRISFYNITHLLVRWASYHTIMTSHTWHTSHLYSSLQVIFRKSDLFLVALLWEMICNLICNLGPHIIHSWHRTRDTPHTSIHLYRSFSAKVTYF